MRMVVVLLVLAACAPADPGKVDTAGAEATDGDGDGTPAGADCDDRNAAIHPAAVEVCDGVDNDCDGAVDEGTRTTVYGDADGDGFGDPTDPREACGPGEDEAPEAGDCDDADAQVYPSADERCDGIDNDCDGQIDEGTRTTVYRDEDGDGFGDPTAPSEACGASDGYVDNRDDCDDTSAAARPGGIEVCDGVDNDCDALTDEDDAMDARTFYADVDGDGFGDPDNTTRSCALGVGYVDQARDCNDMDPDIRPGADEVCDGVDNDCDTLTDDTDPGVDRATGGTWYGDGDGDGYGDPAAGAWACTQPSGSVTDDTDCDDTSAAIHPGAPEVCNGGVDDDCDGYADDADVDVDLDTGTTWYADDDGDSYGDATDATRACVQPSATVGDATDCDDDDAGVHPGAVEVCNGGVDDDCNGDADDADAGVDLGTGTLWYIDDDDDGYGDASDGTPACAQPTGRVADGTDCDDTDGGIHPGTAEVWYDGVDADCGGDDDYDADADGAPSYAEAAGPDCADADPTVQDCGGSAASAGESCASILDSDATLGDGAYWVDPDGLGAFQVDCDMTTDGGGWVELELDSSDAVLVYQYSSSNPWRKCADDAAQHFHHTGTETTVAVDGNIAGAGPVDVTLTYLQPSTGTAYSIAEAEALRSVVGELHPGTRMVALTADDDGGSYEDGDTYGHEVYASDEGGTWTVLTPGTNGECGGSSSWPQAGSQSAFYLWATDPVDAAVSGTTGMTSGLMPSLPATLVMPVQIRFVVATGGGVAFGWEEAVFLVR